MKTRVEQIPNELWILIFTYLEIKDIIRCFTNLNKYFDNIVASRYLSFTIELKAECNDTPEHLPTLYLSDSILNRTICLQSSIHELYDYFPDFFQNHGTKLIRLKSLLITANIKEIPYICTALQQFNQLKYLSLTCIPNQNLLQCIFTSSSLRQCRLHFWRVPTYINNHFNTNSNIEILSIKLQDDLNHSIMNILLSHMPKLKKLEIIEENFLNKTLHPLFNQQIFLHENLKILKLTWGYHDIESDCFKHLSLIMPNLQYLYLNMFYYKLNDTLFDNLIDKIWLIFEKMIPIKISIVCRRLMETSENNLELIFNNYCQRILHTLNSRLNKLFQVKWIQENLKRHRIEIILKKF